MLVETQLILLLQFDSWPLALVGKFIPVPKTPLSSKLSALKCWGKKKSSGEGITTWTLSLIL